jgi:hypothetical protein
VEGYYDSFLGLADRACEDGFILAQHREMLLSGSDAAQLLDRICGYEPPLLDKWAGRGQR